MKWMLTFGVQPTTPGLRNEARYLTIEIDDHPMEWFQKEHAWAQSVADAENVIREDYIATWKAEGTRYPARHDLPITPPNIWIVFAAPIADQSVLAFNVIAECAKATNRGLGENPTLPRWTTRFMRLLQDTVGKVHIDVAP